MQKLADISMFELLQQTANERMGMGHLSVFNPVENAPGIGSVGGGTPPVDPASSLSGDSPNTPQWRRSVDERLGNLERNMKQGFARVDQALQQLSNKLDNR